MKIKNLKLTLFDFYFGRKCLFEVFGDYLDVDKLNVKDYYTMVKRLKIIINSKFPDLNKKTFYDFSLSHDIEAEIFVPLGMFTAKKKSKNTPVYYVTKAA